MNKNIYFLGQVGSDAGGWYIGADGKIHRIPGWAPDLMKDLVSAVSVIRHAGQIKVPGFGGQIMKEAVSFANKQFAEHVTEGGIIVINGR
jgi:hypothetical protein